MIKKDDVMGIKLSFLYVNVIIISLIIITFHLNALEIQASDTSVIINNYQNNPRDIAEALAAELKERNFDFVNKYFSKLVAEKPITKDGYSLIAFLYGYLPDMLDEGTMMSWCNPKVASQAAYIVRGYWYVDKAWEARGTDWGYTVSAEREDIKADYINLAQFDFELAYKMDPSDPYSSAGMITICTAKGFPKEVMEMWFQRAVKADPSCVYAYARKLNFLRPVWYGSQREMKEFAQYCYENSPPGSTVYKIMLHYIFDTTSNIRKKGQSPKEYIEQPEVNNIITDIFYRLDKEYPFSKYNKSSKAVYYSILGRRDESLKLYNEYIDDDPKSPWGYYLRGNFYGRLDMYSDAEADYSKVISIKPGWSITYFLLSSLYQQRDHDYIKAMKYIDKAISINPDRKYYYFYKGEINSDHKKYELAIKSFSDALKIDPYYAPALEKRGMAYEDLNQYEKAIEDYLSVKELRGGDDPGIDYLLTRVQNMMTKGDRKTQIEQLAASQQPKDGIADSDSGRTAEEKPRELTPEDVKQMLAFGKKSYFLRKSEEAKAIFNQVLAVEPMNSEANFMMGQVFDNIDYDFREAVEYYSKAILGEKDSDNYLFARGKASYMLRDYNAAISDFDRVLAINPTDGKAYYYRALSYDGLGNTEAAIKDMQLVSNYDADLANEAGQYLQRHVQHEQPKMRINPLEEQRAIAEENMRMNRYDQAEKNWTEILNIDLYYAGAYFNLGLIAIERDRDHSKAIEYFGKAIEIDKTNVGYYYYRANSYKFLDNCGSVITDCNTILQIDSKYASAYKLRAECYEKNGDFVKAQNDYKNAKKYDPALTNSANERLAALSAKTGETMPESAENADFLIKRSDSYLVEKEFELAIKDINTAINLDPENSMAYYKLGRIYADKFQDHEKAIKYFSKAITLNDSQTEYTFQRGLSYYAMQSWELAKDDFSPTITNKPTEGRAYYYRGMCNKKLNKKDLAAEDLIKAKELDPAWTEGVDRELESMM